MPAQSKRILRVPWPVQPAEPEPRLYFPPDIADAVDYVLTFQEVQDMFEAADIHPQELGEDEKEHSSRAGRLYARTGGVSEAVRETVKPPPQSLAIRLPAHGEPVHDKFYESWQSTPDSSSL